ncbi:hypothetical protein ILUMI_15285, partial [Ignelater luminosus]
MGKHKYFNNDCLEKSQFSKKTLQWFPINKVDIVEKSCKTPNTPELRSLEKYWVSVKGSFRKEGKQAKCNNNFRKLCLSGCEKVTEMLAKSNGNGCLTVCESDLQKAINSFPSGSGSGIDGLIPQHLKDMTSKSASDAGRNLLMFITQSCNFMLVAKQRYCSSTDLIFGNQVILSLVGVQQGDFAGPITFTLATQLIIDELKSELNVFYLNKGTLSDDPEVALSDFILPSQV